MLRRSNLEGKHQNGGNSAYGRSHLPLSSLNVCLEGAERLNVEEPKEFVQIAGVERGLAHLSKTGHDISRFYTR